MTQQTPFQPADQAAFLQALGFDPRTVVGGTITIGFDQQGIPMIGFQCAIPVSPAALGMAFMASGGMMGQGAAGEAEPIEPDITEAVEVEEEEKQQVYDEVPEVIKAPNEVLDKVTAITKRPAKKAAGKKD